jgi:ketosteroid isomerase-like protein
MTDPIKAAEEAVRNFDTAILEKGDLDLAMEYAHPDLTVREAPGLPYKNVYVGREGLTELMNDVGGVWEFLEPLKLTFRGVTPELALGRFEARARLTATGREVDFLVTEWVTVRDGKVADVEVFYWDQAPILEAAAVGASG